MDTYQRADTAIKSHTPDPPMKKLILSQEGLHGLRDQWQLTSSYWLVGCPLHCLRWPRVWPEPVDLFFSRPSISHHPSRERPAAQPSLELWEFMVTHTITLGYAPFSIFNVVQKYIYLQLQKTLKGLSQLQEHNVQCHVSTLQYGIQIKAHLPMKSGRCPDSHVIHNCACAVCSLLTSDTLHWFLDNNHQQLLLYSRDSACSRELIFSCYTCIQLTIMSAFVALF